MLNMGYVQLSLVLLVVFLCKFSFSSSLCRKDQSMALLKFKETLTIDPTRSWCYPKTVSWNMSRDCCVWDGVKCDEFTGHVIELDLSCSQLKGKIDSNNTLFELSHLQRLNISQNDFSDSHISPSFGRLLSLTHLDLTSSSFSGQIPSEISHLSKLQYFHIHSSGDLRLVAHDFKLLLKNLTQLKELDLSHVNISSTIPPIFSSHITTLRLGSTGLHGIIPESIFHLPNLVVLDLGHNAQLSLSGYFTKTKWNSSASLVELDLTRVNFSSNLPESLAYLTSLHHLSLRNCNLWGPTLESLSNLTRIEYLDLGDNSLNGTVPSWIFSHSSLSHFDLKNNNFSGQLEDFKYNTLVWINLKGNQLQGHLPKSIQNLVNLEVLDLSSNNFSGQVDVSYFSNHNQLTDLDLSYNRISLTNENEVKLSLPKSLFRLLLVACEVKELEFLRSAKRLETLDLSYNKIQGRIPNWAWSNWMFSLQYLDLSHNMLESVDSIPPESYVYWIDLQSNFLQGPLPIPPNFTEYFFISNNNLRGEIPSSVCTVTSLRVLDLARNNLEGAIPHCLGNMSSQLEVLDVQRNSLSGDLQMAFSFRNGLKSFNLHGNKLEGKLPRSLVNCQHLEVLDLGGNHFSDTFPMWLGTLPKLQVLSLRSNKLYGSIRTSRINLFPQLRIVDLSGNAFSAELPTSLFKYLKAMRRSDRSMKAPKDGYYQDSVTVVTKGLQFEVVRILSLYTTIDLSNNKFEGHIPSVLGDFISLRVLNLSHNGLQGHIPQSLGNLSLVESLDLSFNQLAGKIPEQLASQLTSLAVLNLSHNHLEGCIPRGPQFATFQNNSYEGNDGLRGFPISKGCGNDRVSETNNTASAVDDQESNYEFLNDFWKAVLVGYGSGLCIGLSIVYFMLSTGNLKWLARIIEGLEHRIIARRKKKQQGQRHYRRRNYRF